jgi:circadian clock protein KaiC
VLLAGPSGTGKSVLSTQFITAGLRKREGAIIVIFEERPAEYSKRAATFGLDLDGPRKAGLLEILYLRPLDLSVDETVQEILDAVKRTKAKRLVIDSLVGFEMALAPGFRADFRESLYRMIAVLTGAGVTIMSTVEIEDSFTAFQFSHYAISFLTDDIIRLRYVEIDGQLRKIIVVIKTRGGNHSKDIREYIIDGRGIVFVEPHRTDYTKMTSGLPERVGERKDRAPEARSLT